MDDLVPVLCAAVLIIAGAAFGVGVFWVLKKLTKLPTRTYLVTHIVVRSLSSLLAFFASVVAVYYAILLSSTSDAGIYYLIPGFLLAGIPALAFGAGLGQRTRRR